jgi:hypothetical protein
MLLQQHGNAGNVNPLPLNKDLNHIGANYSRQNLQQMQPTLANLLAAGGIA